MFIRFRFEPVLTVVLIAVFGFGSAGFRSGFAEDQRATDSRSRPIERLKDCQPHEWQRDDCQQGASGETRPETNAITPRDVIRPFNGKDLSGFTTWLKKSGRHDPLKVFQVKDGVIRCGDEDLGYLATHDAYENYHLVVEYKWGQKPDDSKYVRNSGLLLHAVGPDGSANGVWMTSIECQLAQGCEGDLIVISGRDAGGRPFTASIASLTKIGPDKKTRWDPQGQKVVYSGKQFWWSMHQPFFEELLDTKGAADVASPLGEWTQVECLCAKSRITIRVNGVTVNECFDANPSSGKILLQTEGAEVFFRNLEIRPLAGR